MKTKHKKLSLLLSLSMLMSVSPTMVFAEDFTSEEVLTENAADHFAANEEIGHPIPDDVPVVYDVEEDELSVVAEPPYLGSGTQNDPYIVDIATDGDFKAFRTWCEVYRDNRYFKVTLKDNLDLSSLTPPSEWKGYLNFFMGTFDGGGFTISGIPENCYLFYQIHNADIGNFKLDLNGVAGSLMYYTFRINKRDGSIEWGKNRLHDIDVVSDTTIQLAGNNQANYAPFMFAAGSYFTMQNCNNYANISGDTYAAVFSGYYPLPATGYPSDSYFKFIDCENHGDVTLRYAGLFFGNPTGLRADRNITFEGVKNYGAIRGIESSHFFSSDAGANDYFTGTGYFSEQENFLDPKDEKGNFTTENNPMRQKCEGDCVRKDPHYGTLFKNQEVSGLKVRLSSDGKGYQVIVPENANPNYKYIVNAYCYVSIFLIQKDSDNNEILVPDGTTRITMSEEVTVGNQYTTSRVKNAKLHNDPTLPIGMPAGCRILDLSQCLYFCPTSGQNYGYWINSNDVYNGTHRIYVSHNQEPSSMDWSVYVSVYEGNKLVDIAVLDRQEVTQ